MKNAFRADQVGSFLRPPELQEAHAAYTRGELSLEALRELEDEAILKVFAFQQEAGIEIYSDGEYRRPNWSGAFIASVDGFVDAPIIEASQTVSAARTASPGRVNGLSGRVIGAKLKQKRRLTEVESAFLKQRAPGPYKVTMPAPSYIVARAYRAGVTDLAYSSRTDVLADVARIIRGEVEALVREGAVYIQLDNPHYPDYVVPERRAQLLAEGIDAEAALREDIAADNAAFEGLDLSGVTTAMHLCRGNGPGGVFHTAGGYEVIAEQVFTNLKVDRLLLEYDSERAGGFEPLRFLPRDKIAVLGIVTTKSGALESQADVEARIEEAAKFAPLENLALSPQCGFASVMKGNPLSWDEQRLKLELVATTARKIWTE